MPIAIGTRTMPRVLASRTVRPSSARPPIEDERQDQNRDGVAKPAHLLAFDADGTAQSTMTAVAPTSR